MSVASRRAARKASGKRAQSARKKAGKSIKSSSAAKRARSRASERRRDKRKAADRSAKRAAASAATAAKRSTSRRSGAAAASKARTAATAASRATSRRSGAAAASKSRTASTAAKRATSRRSGAAAASRARSAERAGASRATARRAGSAAASRSRTAATEASRATSRRAGSAAAAKRRAAAAAQAAADRRREQRKASGQAAQRRAALTKKFSSKRPQAKPEGMSLGRAKAGLYNLLPEFLRTDNKSGRTAKQQEFIDGYLGADARRKRRRKKKDRQDQSQIPPRPRTSCPTPDMRILMADGSLKVAGDLQVGNIVRTAHENTLEWGDHKVTHKDIVEDEVVSLKFENSSIKCSPTHKVYLSSDSKWVEVQDLKEGDVVKTEDGDDTFISLEKIDRGEVVVLTVEGAHTYIAEGILSHNKRPGPGGGDDSFQDDFYEDDFYEDDFYEDDFSEDEMMPKRPRRRRGNRMRGRNSGMSGGLGGFGYSPALMQYESQQGAGQVPYYMAAARNAQTPNMSPAFMNAARNYDILGGSQRTAPRPIEMMSARERAEIMNMGSNFNTPNYNSPYQPSPRSEFDFFKQMVDQPQEKSTLADMLESRIPLSGFPGSGPGKGATGKGASKPMSQEEARAMSTGIGSLLSSGMLK